MLLNGIMLPFWGTMIGALLVFFIHKKISTKSEIIIYSFASGIMFSSSIWSLLIPSLEQSKCIIIPIVGFMMGIIFLLIINEFVSDKPINKNKIMIMSIIIHNIPEGAAVGVAFASVFNGYMSIPMALLLSLGIAIQNIPEGAIISIPAYLFNKSKFKSFVIGVLSGIVEPISALIAFIITSKVGSIMPYLLSFAAGSMCYVVIQDLLPQCKSKYTIVIFSIGFLLMIVLESIF